MPWICTICGTSNADDADSCFVCDSGKSLSSGADAGVCTLTARRAEALPPLVEGDLIIPSEYNEIGESAFKDRTDIRIVRIHGGVKKIRKSAFEGCTNLKSVLCNGVLKYIGARAFANCISLTDKPTAVYVADDAFIVEKRASFDDELIDYDKSARFAFGDESLFAVDDFTSESTSSSEEATTIEESTSSSEEATTIEESTSSSEDTSTSESTYSRPKRRAVSRFDTWATTTRMPVSAKGFFATIGLMLGSWVTVALMLVTYYLVFARSSSWAEMQGLVGGVGGFAVFFFLFGWILSMSRYGFARTGKLFGVFVVLITAAINFWAKLQFGADYKILFIWASAYAAAMALALAFLRKGTAWKVIYAIECAVILTALFVGLSL